MISNFIFPIRVYKDYTVPSFITTTVTDDGMASGPATLLQKWKNSAKNELPHIFKRAQRSIKVLLFDTIFERSYLLKFWTFCDFGALCNIGWLMQVSSSSPSSASWGIMVGFKDGFNHFSKHRQPWPMRNPCNWRRLRIIIIRDLGGINAHLFKFFFFSFGLLPKRSCSVP